MPRIGIASQNQVKGRAIVAAFGQMFPSETFEMLMHAADSGVADQPSSDTETRRGAENRLRSVRQALPDCDFWAAIEGGIEDGAQGMSGLAWVLIESPHALGQARTATFPIPERLAQLVRGGIELGVACDRLGNATDTKHHGGAIGWLSDNIVDRQQLYQHAALMALLPIKNPQWYADR